MIAPSRTAKQIAAAIFAAAAVLSAPLSAQAAPAGPPVKLEVGFSPDKPGAQTTVSLGFTVIAPPHTLPPAMTRVEIDLPAGMGIGTTNLGESTCTAIVVKVFGPRGCPSTSFMGLGNAIAEAQLGPEILQEHSQVAILMAPAVGEHTTVLYVAEGSSPLAAEATFEGELLAAGPPYGASVVTSVPAVPAVPEGPDIALVHMRNTLGPSGLTYFRTVKGERIRYRPRGMVIPAICPANGYPFAARFTFLESETVAESRVPCQHTKRHKSKRSRRT
jgi:hypothetical protein